MEILFLIILVGLMMLTLGLGVPVAFALPGSAIVSIGLAAGTGWLIGGNTALFFSHGTAVEWLTAGVTNFRGVYWEADRDTLIAIPLFVFMGIMLQRSRIAEELLVTMAKLFGAMPGGLGISVVVVGALLAATTGIVGATVVAMGLISLPAMLRNNYSHALATGTIMASGTLGQIIPPSIVLIILADQLSSAVDQAGTLRAAEYIAATGESGMPSEFSVVSTSAGDMFMGAILPGLVLVGLYIVFIFGWALIRPKHAPAVRVEGQMDAAFWREVFMAIVPPLALIIVVLGSILMGVSTVTQAGAIGAAGATVMAGYKLYDGRGRYWPLWLTAAGMVAIWGLLQVYDLNIRTLDSTGAHAGAAMAFVAVAVLLAGLGWSLLRTLRIQNTLHEVMIETAKTSALVFVILLGAAMLISAFRAFGGEALVKDFLTGLPGGFWMQFFIVMLVVFVLGFFLDFIEIAIVVVPIVAPILLANPEANVTAVWLGVLIGLNIQTSFLTPPFGFALFYLRGVASSVVSTLSMYKGVIPFIVLQVAAVVIAATNPPLVNYLPVRTSLLSENAPPPRNPRLQQCMEEMQATVIPAEEGRVRALIAGVRSAEAGVLPSDRARTLDTALDGYEGSFALHAALVAAGQAIADATPSYRPLHREVFQIRRDALRLAEQIRRNEQRITILRGDDPDIVAAREALVAENAALAAEREAVLATIPDRWDPEHEAFLDLVRAEGAARTAWRRATDPNYVALRDLAAEIGAAQGIAALVPEVEALADILSTRTAEEAEAAMRALEERIGAVAGAADLRGAVSDTRRALTGRNGSVERALEAAAEAAELARSEAAWRSEAASTLLPALAALEEATRFTLGLREQPRLQRAQALDLASCLAEHRDISLRF